MYLFRSVLTELLPLYFSMWFTLLFLLKVLSHTISVERDQIYFLPTAPQRDGHSLSWREKYKVLREGNFKGKSETRSEMLNIWWVNSYVLIVKLKYHWRTAPYKRTPLFFAHLFQFSAQPVSRNSRSFFGYSSLDIWTWYTKVGLPIISYNFCNVFNYLALRSMIPPSHRFSPCICKWHSHIHVCSAGLFTVSAKYVLPCSWSVLQLEFSGVARQLGRFLFSPVEVLRLPPSGCLWAGPSSRQLLLLALKRNELKQWNHTATI